MISSADSGNCQKRGAPPTSAPTSCSTTIFALPAVDERRADRRLGLRGSHPLTARPVVRAPAEKVGSPLCLRQGAVKVGPTGSLLGGLSTERE
jgi:hypothetical protein